jgi:dinuclear metal center YbgI/SA1388 family protein
MTIRDITDCIESIAPLNYSEEFDNVGLLVGNSSTHVTGVLVTLDTLETIVDEAIAKNCNLIVSFHPILFSAIKKITGSNYVERTLMKAIKADIAIYAVHTALDNSIPGVNSKICEVLELKNPSVLINKSGTLRKLTTYVPPEHANTVRKSLFKAGAGTIGNYSHCSFNTEGFGTYLGNEDSNPTLGEKGTLQQENELLISVLFEEHLQRKIVDALFETHPYEEIAFDIIKLENENKNIGIGMIGELAKPMAASDFLNDLKNRMNVSCIKHSKLLDKPIKKVAVLGGSGSFAISHAIKAKADLFLTADVKYHDFFKAENKMVIADIGHFESEQFTKNLLVDILTKKFPNFAIILSENTTNPIYYL